MVGFVVVVVVVVVVVAGEGREEVKESQPLPKVK